MEIGCNPEVLRIAVVGMVVINAISPIDFVAKILIFFFVKSLSWGLYFIATKSLSHKGTRSNLLPLRLQPTLYKSF